MVTKILRRSLLSLKIRREEFASYVMWVKKVVLITVGVGYYGTEDYGTVVPWLAENDVIAHFES